VVDKGKRSFERFCLLFSIEVGLIDRMENSKKSFYFLSSLFNLGLTGGVFIKKGC
jgi:hypothetical protein